MLQDLFIRLSWPLALAMACTFGYQVHKSRLNFSWPIKEKRWLALSALIMTAIVGVSVRHEYRTLADETNLLSVSQSMLYRHTIENGVTAEVYYDVPNPTGGIVPKRPVLFSFFQSVVHTLFGFQPMAGVWVNLGVLFCLLFIVGSFFWVPLGLSGAIATQLLIISQPVVSMYAASAGYDLLAASFIVFALYALYIHLYENDANSFKLFLITLTLLCHCRYESFSFAGTIFFLAWLMGAVSWKHIKESKLMVLACALFLLPLPIQQLLSFGGYENPPGTKLFGLANFFDNIKVFRSHFWRLDLFIPYNVPLSILAIVVAPLLTLYLALRRHRAKGNKMFFVAAAVVVLDLAIVLFHVDGEIVHPTQVRYFLYPSIFAVFVIGMLAVNIKKVAASLPIAAIVFFFTFHSVAVEDKIHRTLILNRELRIEMEALKAYNPKRTLIISERPGLFVAQGMGAIGFENALVKGKREELEANVRSFSLDKIVVFQHVYYDGNKIQKGNELDGWKLKEVASVQLNTDHYIRISEVVIEPLRQTAKKL